MGTWLPVQTKVDAKVGPITVRLAHYVPPSGAEDDFGLPWAVLGLCRVTFRFNHDLVTTKRITSRHLWLDPLGWPVERRPTDSEVHGAYGSVAQMVSDRIERHGLTAPAGWEVIVEDEVKRFPVLIREAVDF